MREKEGQGGGGRREEKGGKSVERLLALPARIESRVWPMLDPPKSSNTDLLSGFPKRFRDKEEEK
jgi:hypothetical protein